MKNATLPASPETFQKFGSELLKLCRTSIRHGLDFGKMLKIAPDRFQPELIVRRATFVTLLKGGDLRGCIGSLTAVRPLVVDLARNAYAAAFNDPRFEPVESSEFDHIEIHISILSQPEAMSYRGESDLLEQLQPGIDGLVLEYQGRQATFLPSVWESLPIPQDFLNQLKRKAGFPPDYWSEEIRISRYFAEIIGEFE